jgi:hypothetical protein
LVKVVSPFCRRTMETYRGHPLSGRRCPTQLASRPDRVTQLRCSARSRGPTVIVDLTPIRERNRPVTAARHCWRAARNTCSRPGSPNARAWRQQLDVVARAASPRSRPPPRVPSAAKPTEPSDIIVNMRIASWRGGAPAPPATRLLFRNRRARPVCGATS